MTVTVEEVRGALDNAEANGHTFEDMTDEEIASDMLAFWSEVEGMELDLLTSLVHDARALGTPHDGDKVLDDEAVKAAMRRLADR